MKKLFAGLISLAAALLAVCAITVCAGAETSGDYEYEILDDGTVEITDYYGSATELEIPSTIDEKKVTNIGLNAFLDCFSLTSVTIPDGVTDIELSAFSNCINLVSIKIPDSVTNIGDFAFSRCSSLISITIPDGVTSIGNSAFYGCKDLTSINIPNGVTSIEYDTFDNCSSLTSINIPDGVTRIEFGAFNGCSSLKSIKLPDSVTSIEHSVFSGCSSLESITMPDSLINLGEYAFSFCSNLISINIPDGVTKIETSTFAFCSSLTSIIIPEGVTNVREGAFEFCSKLNSITIPESVAKIEDSAFESCDDLKDVYYAGLKAQWDKIAIGSDNEALLDETIHYGKHISADPIKENEVPATCGKDGSYDEVVYCSDCGEKLSSETVIVPATGKHTYVDKVVAPTYTAEGYTEHTCSVCGDNYKDTYTAKKTIPAPSSVIGLKLKGRAADALRISWTKNTSADGYIIEMKSGSTWTRVGKIDKNSTVEFKKSKLKAGTVYTFRIRAYKMDGKTALYSGYTTISARTNPSAVSGLKLKGRSGDALRIAWNKNTSADGYIVEMKSGSTWTRVGKITSNSTVEFKKSKLKAGTAYTFRVKAYKMSGKTALYGAAKTISVRTNPSTVSGLKLKNSTKDAVRLSWTKNTSADGYIVEMKVNGVWKRAGKITKNSTVEFKKSGLKSKTSYTFRIKTYKMSGSTALYSATKTITVKTK